MASKNKSTVFQEFINKNSLKKKELAEYLGVSAAFISQIAQGQRDLPNDKLALIKANQNWDVTMFSDYGEMLKGDAATPGLLELVQSQQRTIEMQAETIRNLTK